MPNPFCIIENIRSAMVTFMQGKHAALIAMAIGVALAVPQNAHADWLCAITRQTVKQASKHAADQATKNAQSRTDQRTQSTFGGYNCTVDCSGHQEIVKKLVDQNL